MLARARRVAGRAGAGRWTRPADRRTADIHILELAPLRRGPARARPWPRLGAPRPRRAPRPRAPSFARVLRRPWELGQELTCDMGSSRAMLSVCRVAGERPRHYKYQSLNEHTSVVREAMERRSAPSPARPGPGPGATRDRHYNGTGLQPPPPRLPRRGRVPARPYTEPGRVVRRYHGTFHSFLLTFSVSYLRPSAPLPPPGPRFFALRDCRVRASCDLNLSFAVKKTSATSDRHS